MGDENTSKKEMGEATDVKMDDFLRTLLGQMFENDNDTTYLRAKLQATDGSESDLEFMIRITSIDGIACRDDEEETV